MFRQAILNLLLNAIQAMPRGGTVKLRTSVEMLDGHRVACVDVEDEGGGISPEVKDRLFEPFFTTKAKGTGLGLAVVKRILDAHRGDVVVYSEPGKGTRFQLRLPLGDPETTR
jgi:signal transduction histidine kinase